MTHLYEITGQMKELAAMADADESMAVAVADTLEAMAGEFNDKAQAVAHVILNMDSDVGALDAEIERLQARKKVITNKKASIFEYLQRNMEQTGITKISCPLFTITLAQGREIAVIDNEQLVPDELMRVKTDMSPDKTEILKKLKAGEEVPGAHIERAQSAIRIK